MPSWINTWKRGNFTRWSLAVFHREEIIHNQRKKHVQKNNTDALVWAAPLWCLILKDLSQVDFSAPVGQRARRRDGGEKERSRWCHYDTIYCRVWGEVWKNSTYWSHSHGVLLCDIEQPSDPLFAGNTRCFNNVEHSLSKSRFFYHTEVWQKEPLFSHIMRFPHVKWNSLTGNCQQGKLNIVHCKTKLKLLLFGTQPPKRRTIDCDSTSNIRL